jgi:3-oxoacyl-[acyl-carrier protein] reductase
MISNNQPLNDEIVLVTGASRGIGKTIALALGAQGATVVGTATSDNGAEAITKYLSESSINGQGMKLNVTDQGSVDHVITEMTETFGSPSILINNAGITRDNLLMRMKEDEWDDIIDTNLTSVYRMSKACLRAMTKARKGRIISISSVVGVSGNAGQTNYSAAKAGLIGFTKSLAREVGARGITVNAVAPGFIDTDMTRALPDAQKEALLSSIPLKRLGNPEEIASAVAFLASPGAAYISGETLHVNGGMYMA